MKILLKKALILSDNSPYHNSVKDILLDNGVITDISNDIISEADQIIVSDNLNVSIGWLDIGCRLGDPGFEHKEDLVSGSRSAVFGGYTELACLPNTNPCIQNKEHIYYLNAKSHTLPIHLHVIAAVTENLQGKVMTELVDLSKAGAIAFSDGGNSIEDSGMLIRLIQYLNQIDGILMVHAEDKSISHNGVMHEGEQSVFLGLKGIPGISEEIAVDRNISLLNYTNGRLHFSKISTALTVQKIREAKHKGLKITCDVSVAHLIYNDTYLAGFDTNYKTNPPLRSGSDQEALWEGLQDGTIDAIISDHNPQDEESKNLEFDQADFGMIQLETAFSLLNNYNQGRLSMIELVNLISKKPRQILTLPVPAIKKGETANLTVFDPQINWLYNEARSRSRNSPELGNTLKGKVLAVINKGQFIDLRK